MNTDNRSKLNDLTNQLREMNCKSKIETTIDISNESLEDAINRIGHQYVHWEAASLAAHDGVRWQKEKDKAIIDELTEGIKLLIYSDYNNDSDSKFEALQNAHRLLNQLNETKKDI